jgi:TonB-linked SusC/RagA family outer membrane protein
MRLLFYHPAGVLKSCLTLLCLLMMTAAYSQKTISGTIRDEHRQPLKDVSVRIKNKAAGTISDSSGQFKLKAAAGDTLVFSLVNYTNAWVKVDAKTAYNITLIFRPAELEEVISIGYGAAKKKDLTGAVDKVNMKDLEKAPVRSFDEALAGRVAGVTVSSVDGQPGSAINVTVRGANSITQDNSPLYIIDGFPVENPNNNLISPQDIESIEILKDASSTAIYGARGANGVIIITTKRGKAGPPAIRFNTSFGIQRNINSMEVMSPYEFVKYQQERDSATAALTYLNGKTLDYYKTVQGSDWQSLIFRTALMQNHNLSVSGGNDKTKYALSGSFTGQDGTIINSGYNRYQGRIVLDQTINPKLKVGINTNYTVAKQYGLSPAYQSTPNASLALMYSVWGYRPVSYSGQNLEDVLFDPDITTGLSASDYRINPVINQQNILLEYLTNNLVVNAHADYAITKDLKLRISGGFNNNRQQANTFFNSNTIYGSKSTGIGYVNGVNGSVIFTDNNSWVNENVLTYNKKIRKNHTLNFTAGITEQGRTLASYGNRAINLPNESLGIEGLDEGTPRTINATKSNWTLLSFLGRVNYSFKSTYLLTFSMRADGSSKFEQQNRWGYFPSGALAWRFTDEKFIGKGKVLNDGKLRVSYGKTGNNRVGDFSYLSAISTGLNGTQTYVVNNNVVTGAVPLNIQNKDLKWETTGQVDAGIDLSLLKNRISVTADVYRKDTKDLLLNAALPTSTGYNTAFKNVGSIRNQGLELTINTENIKQKNFSWTSSFNISFVQSKVLSLTQNQESITANTPFDINFNGLPAYLTKINMPVGMMYGLVWDGVYQYSDFNQTVYGTYILKDDQPTNGAVRNTIRPGDIKYKDLNGDGVVDASDYTIIGRGLPIHTGGFNNNFTYQNFELGIFLQWSYGNDIYNANRLILEGNAKSQSNLNQFASYSNRWSPQNTATDIFRTGGQGPAFFSSRIVENGSFLRLKTVSLTYNFPAKLLSKMKLKNISAYLAAQNLYTWTSYSGLDPEVSIYNSVLTPGFDYSAYPRARTMTVGLNVFF